MSAIAIFLIYFLAEEKGRVTWERGEVGEESGQRTGRIWRCGKWEYTKK